MPIRILPPAALCSLLLLAFPALAGADLETLDFDTAPPALGAPVDESAGHRIRFPVQEGFRPYRREAGTQAHSGTTVGDVGTCVKETEASGGEPEGCISAQARTTAVLAHTATSVTVFAGRFGPEPEFAVLTAFDVNGIQVATTGPLPISEKFGQLLQVSSADENIAKFRVEARTGPIGETKNGGDLGIDDVKVNFAEKGDSDFFVTTINQVFALVQGQEIEVPVHVARLNGSNGTIELSASDLPAGVSASSVRLDGKEENATIKLTANPGAPDTEFVPITAKLTARPIDVAAGPVTRTAPFDLRVATDFRMSSGEIGEEEERKRVLIETPDCAPVDVPIKIQRDIAMNRNVSLSVQGEEGPGLPPGVSAEFLPSAVVAPGGNLVAERTLRLRAGPEANLGIHTLPVALEGSADPQGASRSLEMVMVRVNEATVATSTPGSGFGFIPQLQKPGSVVRVHGKGFCPGTEVQVGNERAIVPTRSIDDHTIEFDVPREATSGQLKIIPPGKFPTYRTLDRLTVDTSRNTHGFPFGNPDFENLGIDEFTKAFGDEEIFLHVNPCWPFGDCSVPTGFLSPMAALDWGWMNVALRSTSGHCFGIGLGIQLLESGKERRIAYMDRGLVGTPRNAFEMSTPEGPGGVLNDFLDAMHARQFSEEFLSGWLDRPRAMQSSLQLLEREFARGREPLITLEHFGKGHAVLAYDLVRTADGAEIYVYDSRSPFTESEENNAQVHRNAVERSIITIFDTSFTWSFPVHLPTEDVWAGSGGNGTLYVVPTDLIPTDPSLPGLSTKANSLREIVGFGSVEGAVRSHSGSKGADFLPTSEVDGPAGNGVWMTDGKHPLQVSIEGVKRGRYSQLYSAPGFVANLPDVATAKGVDDVVRGGGDSMTFESGTDRPLTVELARRSSGAVTAAATVQTRASAHGSDSAGLARDGALTYAHDGAATTVRFSLTSVRRQGGPSTFVSPPVAVHDGERLRIVPLGRDLRRVRLTVRGKHGRSTRMLRSHGGAPGRVKLGGVSASRRRLSVHYKVARLHGRAVVGAVMRVMRGNHVVVNRAVSRKTANGSRTIVSRLRHPLKKGRYRVSVYLRLVSTGARGSTATGSVSRHRTETVRVK